MTHPSSAQIRDQLAKQPAVILAMSRGKDALGAWAALIDAGCTVIPVHLHLIPRLRWIADDLARLSDHYQTHIHDLPHPTLWRWLANAVLQPPERRLTLAAAGLQTPSFTDVWDAFRADQNLPADTWVATGVRAADSPIRRLAATKHGPWRTPKREVHPIWDWTIADIRRAVPRSMLPVDYAWFGRSFDGLDYRFLNPIRLHAPADYATILEWFPLADLVITRHEKATP